MRPIAEAVIQRFACFSRRTLYRRTNVLGQDLIYKNMSPIWPPLNIKVYPWLTSTMLANFSLKKFDPFKDTSAPVSSRHLALTPAKLTSTFGIPPLVWSEHHPLRVLYRIYPPSQIVIPQVRPFELHVRVNPPPHGLQ